MSESLYEKPPPKPKLPPHLDTPFYREVMERIHEKEEQVCSPASASLPLQDALDEMKAEEVPDAEKHAAIKDVVDRVGYGLAQDETLSDDAKLKEWVKVLQWGLELLPPDFEQTRWHFQNAINTPRHEDYDTELLWRQRHG